MSGNMRRATMLGLGVLVLTACGGTTARTAAPSPTSQPAPVQSTQPAVPATSTSTTSPSTTVVARIGTSRTVPVALAQVGTLARPPWSIRIVSVTPDAGAIVRAENQFNRAAAPGRQFLIARIEMTYNGEGSENTNSVEVEAVGASNLVYSTLGDYCGNIPDYYTGANRVFTGGTVQGNVCWSVKPEDIPSLVMIAHAVAQRDPSLYLSLH